ncbi:MAG: alpha/beta fold hydrolase [Roseovarius sp.]|nr:alpha/beta fold hydrolase [Roseovarius sp.]
MSSDPVVFLPGMMCDARLFAPQIADLSRDMVVAVAPITCGARIEEIAENLLESLPARFALAGLSMGGIVAMEALRRAPGRVTRLALMDTNPMPETEQSAEGYAPLIESLRNGRIAEAVEMLLGGEVLAPGPARAGVLALAGEMAHGLGAETIIAQVHALKARRDYQPVLSGCEIPTLLLCGAEDRLTPPRRHERMAAVMPRSRLVIVEGAGHLPVLEQPQAVTAALRDWLSRG